MSVFKEVALFHKYGGTKFREDIGLPDHDQIYHIMALVTEEYTELVQGLVHEKDPVEAADAFLDLIYVCIQGLLGLGLRPGQIQRLWEEVHHSNMTKVDPSLGFLKDNDNKPYFTDVGKITKPPEFRPPNIAGVLQIMKDFPEDYKD